MKKITNSLLGIAIFAFVGCGGGAGTEQQGAVGNYNKFSDINMVGVWDMYSNKRYNGREIDRNKISATVDFASDGKLYPYTEDTTYQKRAIGSYNFTNSGDLNINAGQQVLVKYNGVDTVNSSCIQVQSALSNSTSDEIWCKRVSNGFAGGSIATDERPQILAESNDFVNLKDYFYPTSVLDSHKTTTEEVHYYTQNAQGEIFYEGKINKEFKYQYNKNPNIIEYHNGVEEKTDELHSNEILSFEKNSYGYNIEKYPARVATNSRVVTAQGDGIEMVCVVKDIYGGLDEVSKYIPNNVAEDLKSRVTGSAYTADQFQYTGVMHIFCGATNGTKIDSYHVNGWGEVLSIVEYGDGSGGRYEILDKKSIQY